MWSTVPLLCGFVRDQHVLAVEEQHAELLGLAARHLHRAIVEQRLPGRERRLSHHFGFGEPERGRLDDLQRGDRVLAQLFFPQPLDGRGDDIAERPEAVDEALGQRLGVHARDRHEQEKLEQLVIGERVAPAVHEALAQSLAMAKIVRKVVAPRFGQLRCRGARAALSARG